MRCLWNFFFLVYLFCSICPASPGAIPFVGLHIHSSFSTLKRKLSAATKPFTASKQLFFLMLINSMSCHICLFKEASHTQAHYYQSDFPHPPSSTFSLTISKSLTAKVTRHKKIAATTTILSQPTSLL